MIKLYAFGPAFGLVDPSPFVTKVHLFMTMHNIEFELEVDANQLTKAPKKKFPFIDHDGKIVADSAFILEYLSKQYSINMDDWLSDEQFASAHLIAKSLEENLYWCLVHSRWMSDDTWPQVKNRFFNDMPFPLKYIVPAIARSGTRKRIVGHGMGAHSNDEINHIAQQSFASISTLLGNKEYFFGDRVSSLDIIIFSQIGAFTLATFDNSASLLARQYDNLVDFTQRIQNKYYPHLSTNL